MLRLIHFGRIYYEASSTIMGALTDERGVRSDWGKVQIALEEGEEVHIRPATPQEHEMYLVRFDELVDDFADKGWVQGLGNYDPGTAGAPTPEVIADAVARVKRAVRERVGVA